jgi:protein SCO1/2
MSSTVKHKKPFLIPAIILGVLVIASVGARLYLANKDQQAVQSQQAFVDLGFYRFDKPRTLSEVSLNNLQGEVKPFTQHSSGWRIVNTGYLSCPDICPINLSLLSNLKEQWDQQEGVTPFEVVHITFDPKRDTPDLLKRYLAFVNPSFYGLTGDVESIRKLTQQLNMVFIYDEPDTHGNYFVTHSDSMAVINPDGQYVGLFKGPYNMANMTQALALLINQ